MASNKAEEVLRDIERMAEKEFLPIVGPRKGKVLAETVREVRPKRVLEVGTLIGYSAILIGRELDKNTQLITIEIHEGDAKMAEENIKRAQIPPTVQVLVGDAVKIIPQLQGQFDLVFIDAEKTEYFGYLRLVEDKLHKGSVVVADNVGIPADQMRDYLNYMRRSGKYKSRYVGMGEDGLEISLKL